MNRRLVAREPQKNPMLTQSIIASIPAEIDKIRAERVEAELVLARANLAARIPDMEAKLEVALKKVKDIEAEIGAAKNTRREANA
jgi:hypothetical protein